MPDNLLKVVFVDDEHLVRSLLKNCVDWHEMGFQVAGEAADGREALELVDRVQPDVVFTDIYMPFMDGLELGRLIFEKDPSVKIVVLTGYEEFEYAKKSIKIGISDFLLKPVNDDEIRKAALSLKEKILEERDHRSEYERMKKQLEENLPVLREKLLNELIQGTSTWEDVRQRVAYFKIDLGEDYLQVAVIEASVIEASVGEETGGTGIDGEMELLIKLQCREWTSRYFRNDPGIHVFCDNAQNVVIINGERELDLSDCLESVRVMLVNKLKCPVTIGLGNTCTCPGEMRKAYREAVKALQYKMTAGKNQVITYGDIGFTHAAAPLPETDFYDAFAFYLKAGMKKKVMEHVEALFGADGILAGGRSMEQVRVAASNLVSNVLNVLSETGLSYTELFEDSETPFARIFRADTLPLMRSYLTGLAGRCCEAVDAQVTRKINQAVEQVKEYIHANLSDPALSLSAAARAHYLNSSYLSRIFKQETGQTFMEYITKTRMDKALRLLKETDMRAYQVAEALGFENPHYFGVCFKKWTGVSVNEYRGEISKKSDLFTKSL